MDDNLQGHHPSMVDVESYLTDSPDEMNAPLIMADTLGMDSYLHDSDLNVTKFQDLHDPDAIDASRAPKPRRKSASGPGGKSFKKHRRTRSGCFTCRSRRVKCDETRPICERCRKGGRDCIFPDVHPSRHGSRQTTKTKSAREAATSSILSGVSRDDSEDELRRKSICNGEELDAMSRRSSLSQASRRMSTFSTNTELSSGRQSPENPSEEDLVASPPSSPANTTTWTPAPYQTPELILTLQGSLDYSHLPLDLQHHLNYFAENITHYHYGLTVDEDNFFSIILPNIALECEPLLNALVGFSAYHATLQNPNGKLEDFLQYYNRSVTQLLRILEREEMHTVHVLATVLQLATIEEYLGDWANLTGHRKAAFEIITQIFSSKTVTQDPISRMCLNWYVRFDNTVALLSGSPADIPRDWLVSMADFFQRQETSCPEVLRWKMETRSALLRLISYDMSILYVRNSRGQVTPSGYDVEHERLSMRLEDWRNNWDQGLGHLTPPAACLSRASEAAAVSDPRTPGVLPHDPIFNNMVIAAEWHSTIMMHKSQSRKLPLEELLQDLSQHAYAVCQHFALMEHWPSVPGGILIAMQPSMSIAALFLPPCPNTNMWLRRKFALLESLGQIHPRSRRKEMAEILHDTSCLQWWLPNREGFTPVIEELRSLTDERSPCAGIYV